MKYKKIISSLSLATALLAVTTLNQEVQANEAPVDTKEKAVVNPSVSENQITEAQKEVKKAQENLDAKAAKDAEAKKNQAKADKKVAETKEAIGVSKNADAIAEEQGKLVAEKVAEKAEAEKALSEAQSTDAEAQEAAKVAKEASQSATENRDAKAADVKAKQAELDGMTDAGIQTQISKTEKEIGVADQVLQAETKKANEAADKVAAKQQELDNYKPTVLKNVLNPEEQGHTAPASEDDYDYNKKYRPRDAAGNYEMENVAFQGVREVEMEATEEMKRFTKAMADYNANPSKYKTRPTFKFVVDNHKLTEAFLELANELRRANGVTRDFVLDETYLKYAEARANEMATNGILNHDTKLPHPDGEDFFAENVGRLDLRPRTDGGPKFVEVKNGQTIYHFDQIMSYKQFAYESLLDWYSDFTNIFGRNYGHRRVLLVPVGGRAGIAQGTVEGKDPNSIYHAFETVPYGDETADEYRSHYNNFKEDDPLHPTFYGQRMKFLPEHHFVYVEKTVIDKSGEIKDALTKLQEAKATQDARKADAENKKADLLAHLAELNKQANNLENVREQAKKDLDQAKSDLASLTTDAQAKSELAAAKAQAADKASQTLKALQAKVTELTEVINKAETKRTEALALKGQLASLEATLKQAEAEKVTTHKVAEQAELEMRVAQKALAEAKSKQEGLLAALEAENMLKVFEKNGVLVGLPKDSPIQEQLPEFDIRTLEQATAKPQGLATAKPGKKEMVVPKADGKGLPNTGTNSSVESQMALLGGFSLLSSLGLAGLAKRKRQG